MDETTLRRLARHAIRSGKVPARRPDRMWGGSGNGGPCAVCDQDVTRDQMGFDLEFSEAGAGTPTTNYHFHVRCYAVWELEQDFQETQPRPLPAASDDGTISDRERDHKPNRTGP